MIAFFPDPYPDELLYSRLCRYHVRSGHIHYISSCDDLYLHRTVHPDFEFINAYTDDALNWICKGTTFEDVIYKQTMYPAYARFLPIERRINALHTMLNREGNWNNLLAIPSIGVRYMRYCPCCAKEDREKYGEAYWHRHHQLCRVRICPKHQCLLKNSEIRLSSNTNPSFFDAETYIPLNEEPIPCYKQKEIDFVNYVIDVMEKPVDLTSEYPIGYYLHGHLGKYCSESGLVRDIRQLFADYADFYGDIPIAKSTIAQKVFNGYYWDCYYVLTIAFFLGISVDEITHLPNDFSPRGIEALYKELAEKYKLNFETVKKIGNETLKYTRKHIYLQRKSGVRAQEYGDLDERMLPLVKSAVEEFYSTPGRPQKLSVAGVQRILNLPQKQLTRLPKCYAYIIGQMETQNEFLARVIETWAIPVLRENGKRITASSIIKLINCRKNDIKSCCKYIKNENIRLFIQQLVDLVDEQ